MMEELKYFWHRGHIFIRERFQAFCSSFNLPAGISYLNTNPHQVTQPSLDDFIYPFANPLFVPTVLRKARLHHFM